MYLVISGHLILPCLRVNQEKSELLCNAIGGDKMSCFFEKGHLALIQRFLNPDLMLSKPELPNPLREDEEVLVLQQGGRQALKQRKGNKEDPLIELFRPSENQPLGRFVSVLLLNLHP